MPFRDLEAEIKKNSHLDLGRISKAYEYAEKIHENQKRKSGEPYIIHPVEVARIILQAGGDENMIIAALLHDVIEDGEDPEKVGNEVYHQFGGDVFYLVQSLSKDGNHQDKKSRDKAFFDQIKKALETDVSVFFIKMSDLIHNMGTLSALAPEKQEKWINELKNNYLPYFSEYFHKISFHYHPIYHRLMEELEKIIEDYEGKKG